MISKKQDSGVSPVIGVILMVAVTVALVALVTVIVFDIGGDVSESPDATVELKQTNGDVQATLLRNENVEGFRLEDAGGDQSVTFGSDAGATATVDSGNLTDGESVNVIAEMPGGSEEVLTSTEYEG